RIEKLDRSRWREVLHPGTALLEMHIPEDARLDLGSFVESARSAERLFARVMPDRVPRGLFGDAWLLDPQIAELYPNHVGLLALQAACSLFPGRVPEDKTIRRIFGPEATRESVVAMPRDRMSSLQRAIHGHLADPSRHLLATGGVLLSE